MISLALDTSHDWGGMAVASDGEVLAVGEFGRGGTQLAGIASAAQRCFESAGLSVGEVDRVAVVIGPGSFTGLRIGLSFAKGLAAGANVDMATVASLELIALPFLAQTWMFATPVVYPTSLVPEGWRLVYALNPMTGLIQAHRDLVLGTPVDFATLGISTATGLVLAYLGVKLFARTERRFADVV